MISLEGINYHKAFTTAGRFTAQQVMCGAILRILDPELPIERRFKWSAEPGVFCFGERRSIVDRRRCDGTLYGSVGYVWSVVSENLPLTQKQIAAFDRDICIPLDAAAINNARNTPIVVLLNAFNARVSDDSSRDAFEEAVAVCTNLISEWFRCAETANHARDIAQEGLKQTEDKSVLILDEAVPFSAIPDGVLFLAYPCDREMGFYKVVSVIRLSGLNVLFPAKWRDSSRLPEGVISCNAKGTTVEVISQKSVYDVCKLAKEDFTLSYGVQP